MPRGFTPKDENGAPLLGQGGAGSSRLLLPGWFESR
jgi:hypothetical protein